VVKRFELGYSWAETVLGCSRAGTPGVRTMQRWCVRLAERAPEWLGAMERVMAEQDSRSEWLDPHGEAVDMRSVPQAMLRASLHFLAWAQGRWREVAHYGLNDRLRFLWYWGNRQAGLPRLAAHTL
jgi:hypothetical protein